MAIHDLSTDKCVLLAASLASESNIEALDSLFATRQRDIDEELQLRILLAYLPEACEPSRYTALLSKEFPAVEATATTIPIDDSQITKLSDKQARSRRKHLALPDLDSPSCPSSEAVLTRFLICRSHRLADAGLLQLVPQLLEFFLEGDEFLRTWFIGNVLPLLRLSFEYYPDETQQLSLGAVERATGEKAIDMWLARAFEPSAHQNGGSDNVEESLTARDMKGLVGPWMYGSSQRKRRKLEDSRSRQSSMAAAAGQEFRRLSLDGANLPDASHEWENAFTWLAQKATTNLPAMSEMFDEWDGPVDIDFGGFVPESYLAPDMETLMRVRYVQTAFTAVYAAESESSETISSAHSMLVRIAQLMEFEPPPDLATSVEMLPKIDADSEVLSDFSTAILDPDVLLKSGHPLTNPNTQTFALLQMFVYSAYILAELGFPMAIVKTAMLKFHGNVEEQNTYLQKMLHAAASGGRKDDQQLQSMRNKLLWLWGWGISDRQQGGHFGYGILGKIDKSVLERDILKVFLLEQCYDLVDRVYIQQQLDAGSSQSNLSMADIEACIVAVVLSFYDNASNGNRTRGSLKKATETVRNLRAQFPHSLAFRRIEALLSATHALSFYTLVLQYGVPFQPVAIRVIGEPITLIEKVLAQNDKSYTHLDDLVSIGKNLSAAGLMSPQAKDFLSQEFSLQEAEDEKRRVERKVIGMAIEAALQEDDFETAYSYVVNRLGSAHHSQATGTKEIDDISWRAALAAGRHKSSAAGLSSSNNLSTPPALRRLEQRMELLSQALLLAPQSHLLEVLNVWRKCEEEMTALLARDSAEEAAFDQAAEQGRQLPGSFISSAPIIQPRREIGRGGTEESPMGLFDVARGAAKAFSRSAFPLRGAANNMQVPPQNINVGGTSSGSNRNSGLFASGVSNAGSEGSAAGDASSHHPQRKRDMIAGAASGALASGLGWVLGEHFFIQTETE